MEKIAVVDILNMSDSRHVGRYMPLLMELGGDLAVFYCEKQFVETRPDLIQKLKERGLEIVIDDFERSKTHSYHLASTRLAEDRHSTTSGPQAAVLYGELLARNTKFVYHPVLSDGVLPRASGFPPNSFILYHLEPFFFDGIADGRYILNAQGYPEIGKTDHGVEAVAVGPSHHNDETRALAKRDRQELRAELAERLKVEFKPELPLVFYSPDHHIMASEADKALPKLSEQSNIVIKCTGQMGSGGPNSYPGPRGWPYQGRIFDECYTLAEGPNIHFTRDDSLLSLIRYAADVTICGWHSSTFMTSFVLGRRFIPVYTQQMRYGNPLEYFNFGLWLGNLGNLETRILLNISPINVRAVEMLLERINDQKYWEKYEAGLGELHQMHLGRLWLGADSRKRAAGFVKRVLERGTFAPQDIGNYKVVKGPVQMRVPPMDFLHKYML